MASEIVTKESLGLDSTYNKIARIVRPSLFNAICYLNATRSDTGTENFKHKWFHDIDVISYNKPFSRHIDGIDHTHFIIDVDIRLRYEKEERKYDIYKENLRLLKLEAGIDFFKKWKDFYPNHQFFWKVGGTGLHAIQRINERVSRKGLKDLITTYLFPQCQKSNLKGDMVTIEEYRKSHICNKDCDGWHVPYEKKELEQGSGIFYYFRSDVFWTKIIEVKGRQFAINIDLGYYDHDIKLFRWVYSPYFGVPSKTYFSIPIKNWDMEWIEKYSNIDHVDEIIEDFEIPDFSFYPYVDLEDDSDGTEEDWIKKKSPKTSKDAKDGMYEYHSKYSEKYQKIKLYTPEERDELPFSLKETMHRMTREFHRKDISPCFRAHYIKATSQRGAHFNRFPIVRYLMSEGYNLSQVANWIRFELNDDRDNAPENRHRLMDNLPVVIGDPDNPNPVPGCMAMQKPGGKMHVCDETMQALCGRKHPLSKDKLNSQKSNEDINLIKDNISSTRVLNDKQRFWNNIISKMDRAINMKKNLVMWKATRAGVTTSMIYSCFMNHKKLLVLVPTNKIAMDTFSKAMNIVKEKTGRELRGAVLASNKKSCLLLKFLSYDLKLKKIAHPEWGDKSVAWENLLYHSKPNCERCRFKNATVNIPLHNNNGELIPLHSSKILSIDNRTGWCGYQTFRKQLPNLDVVFMTYSKILSMRSSGGDENKEILESLRNEFDLLFLDEINTIAQSSPTVLKIMENHAPVLSYSDVLAYDLFTKLRFEIEEIKNFDTTHKIAPEIENIIRKFITRFEPLKMRDWTNINVGNNVYDIVHDVPSDPAFRHPLDTQERAKLRDRFNLYHTVIENYSKANNTNLKGIEKVLAILIYDEFVGYNHTSHDSNYLNYIFVVSPVVRELRGFVREFSRTNNNKQIIATDACLPEANVSDILGIEFEDFIIGDPRETNKHQLIVTDANQIFIHDFLTGGKCIQYKCEKWNEEQFNCGFDLYHHRKDTDGEIKLFVEKALYKGVCQKDKFSFLEDVQSVVNAYGAENIFLIFPNIKSYNWFKRIKYRIKDNNLLQYSYFRSDLTIGVECDRRIMITLGSPIPPKNSYLWLAHYYHRLNLLTNYTLNELAEKLRINNMRSAFWQTIGRAKDPLGEKRSFVLCWGMGVDTLILSFSFDKIMKDSLPKYLAIDSRKYAVTSLMQVTDIWRKMGRLIDPAIIKLKDRLALNEYRGQWFSQRELHNKFGTRYHLIEQLSDQYSINDLAYFNLEIKKQKYGRKFTYHIRSFIPQ